MMAPDPANTAPLISNTPDIQSCWIKGIIPTKAENRINDIEEISTASGIHKRCECRSIPPNEKATIVAEEMVNVTTGIKASRRIASCNITGVVDILRASCVPKATSLEKLCNTALAAVEPPATIATPDRTVPAGIAVVPRRIR